MTLDLALPGWYPSHRQVAKGLFILLSVAVAAGTVSAVVVDPVDPAPIALATGNVDGTKKVVIDSIRVDYDGRPQG